MYEPSKRDWKLFRERLPKWQEAYMDKLNKEYITILSVEGVASEKFRKLNDRIKEDIKHPGVLIEPSRNKMIFDILELLKDGAITKNDLEEFSEELSEHIDYFINYNF